MKIDIDDRSISTPPYKGPKKGKLKDRKLTKEEIKNTVDKLFPKKQAV